MFRTNLQAFLHCKEKIFFTFQSVAWNATCIWSIGKTTDSRRDCRFSNTRNNTKGYRCWQQSAPWFKMPVGGNEKTSVTTYAWRKNNSILWGLPLILSTHTRGSLFFSKWPPSRPLQGSFSKWGIQLHSMEYCNNSSS